MINNTLFRPSAIRDNRKKFNPEGFDLAAVLKAKRDKEAADKVATANGKLSIVPPVKQAVSGERHRNAFADFEPIERPINASVSESELVIKAAYKQVFGNAYLMESERLLAAESQLRSGQVTVIEFVRQLAQSDRYRVLFFEACSNLRSIELNFKHLLGRAPESHAEISEHIQILAEGGWEAEIDAYLDSDEYFQAFGANIVPYCRGYQTQTGKNVAGFTHAFQLLRGASSSDKSTLGSPQPQLQTALLAGKPTQVTVLSAAPPSIPILSPLRPSPQPIFKDLSCIPQYKSPEFLAKPLSSADWFNQNKAREAAEIFIGRKVCQPVKLPSAASAEEVERVIQATYKQIFGNAHLMESQRLVAAEDQLKAAKSNVKAFARALAKSDLYRSLFLERYSNVRAVELNFKHFLGRSPDSFREVAQHVSTLVEHGWEAEIDSYFNSQEYGQNFGEDTVPYYVGYGSQTGKNVAGYNLTLELSKAACTSDRSIESSQRPQLQNSLLNPTDFSQTARVFNPKGFDLAKTLGFGADRGSAGIIGPHINAFADSQPVEWLPGEATDQKELVILSAYRQVFGNAHLMESEKFPQLESQLLSGQITVLEFVRQLAKSDRYRNLFFENCSNLRAIELNFKHLLGRAPSGYAEISEHIQILTRGGLDAEIDAYLDSDEYFQTFGTHVVPYYRGYKTQTGQKLTGFTHSFDLVRGASSSDKSTDGNQTAQLEQALLRDQSNKVTELSKLSEDQPIESSPYLQLQKAALNESNSTQTPRALNLPVLDLATMLGLSVYQRSPKLPGIVGPHINAFVDSQPVELLPGAATDQKELVILSAYRQVFGNAHLMESEKFPQLESQLLSQHITVLEFVRQLAKSDRYRNLFFENCSNLRAIELNFKHLLGRAPSGYGEISEHIQILTRGGLDAEIDAYLDSDEYFQTFGENVVPYYRGYKTQTGQNLAGFTHAFDLLRGASSSDQSIDEGKVAQLDLALLSDQFNPVTALSKVPNP